MVDVPLDATDGLLRRPRHFAGVRALATVQLYAVASYLSAAIVPYLLRRHAAPPTWTWIVPGWLLGVPGWWVTLLGPALAVPLAVTGVGGFMRYRRAIPDGLRRWLAVAAVMTTAYALFSFTPIAHTIAVWVAD